MSSYKLVYFNHRGVAEVIRFIFAQAEVTFEDVRVNGEEWLKMKPSTPSGSLPLLEVDGVIVPGSGPIARFLAERFGLAGGNDIENLQLAAIYDLLCDLAQKLTAWFFEKDEERKASLIKAIEIEHIPRYLGILEKKCNENNSADGWIFGSKPTYVDFAIYCYLEIVMMMFAEFIDSYPGIQKLRKAVENLPNIAAWIKERPLTDH